MARHTSRPTPRGRMRSRHWGVLIGSLAVIGLGATAGIATTGGFMGTRATSETPAEGGKYVTTVEDGKLQSLVFVPDATQSPSQTPTGTPAPTSTASPSATSTGPVTATSAPSTTAPSTPSPSTSASPTGKPPVSESPSATQSPSGSSTGTPAPSTSSSPSTSTTAPPAATTGDWLSGVSGAGDTDGSFGTWRGTPVEIVGTWADADDANQRNVYTVTSGSGRFSGPIDIGVGAIVRGETWAQAAQGAYDARWRQSLTTMAKARAGKGTTFIRFAHEMNGNWYPWAVNAGNVEDFKKAWARYRAIQREVFPSAKLVFSVNRESVGNGIDWRKTVPPASQIDVMGVDYYDQNPAATTKAAWDSAVNATDSYGAPKGLEAHRRFALSLGLPLSINEWGDKREQGDGTVYVDQMGAFFKANGGTGPGNVLYEVYFNVPGYDGNYQIYPTTQIPQAAARYRDVF